MQKAVNWVYWAYLSRRVWWTGVDFKTSMLATEALGAGHSFSVAYGAHTGIGTLPLLYYGNDAQKQNIFQN
ncbi:MAG: hypothetical protein CM15mP65_21680 [Crocinitomicaceae bacterium]|nr:MAG: hypothetical protein CM15mP65_21680 [Crocinitomicaceae bacterium]